MKSVHVTFVCLCLFIYMWMSAFTYGWLMHRDNETCVVPSGGRSACALPLGFFWPIYWPYRLAYVALDE